MTIKLIQVPNYRLDKIINSNLDLAEKVLIVVSFVFEKGLDLILQKLSNFRHPNNITILTSNYLKSTEPKALKKLLELKKNGAKVYVFDSLSSNQNFHIKSYYFENKKNNFFNCIIGSSNISAAAFQKSYELNVEVKDKNFSEEYKKNILKQDLIEYIEDSTSIGINVQQAVKSGIKLLEAQSICPAWAFYEFRLGAKKLEDEDEENLTTRLRGNLFHKILEQFWAEHKSASLVSALTEKELSEKIKDITHKAISIEKKKYPRIMPTFFNIEEIRMISYVEKWIQHELKRGDFEVIETEKNIPVHVGCLNFNIKIDRIDRVNENNIVIDYKSGITKTLNEWFLNSYGELQIPFYALFASDKPIDAIAIGVINASKPQWIGIGRDKDLLKGIKDIPSSTSFQSWDELLGFWKCRIQDTIKSYREGNAAVQYARDKDMAYCHVKPILRLPERTLQFEQSKQ